LVAVVVAFFFFLKKGGEKGLRGKERVSFLLSGERVFF